MWSAPACALFIVASICRAKCEATGRVIQSPLASATISNYPSRAYGFRFYRGKGRQISTVQLATVTRSAVAHVQVLVDLHLASWPVALHANGARTALSDYGVSSFRADHANANRLYTSLFVLRLTHVLHKMSAPSEQAQPYCGFSSKYTKGDRVLCGLFETFSRNRRTAGPESAVSVQPECSNTSPASKCRSRG